MTKESLQLKNSYAVHTEHLKVPINFVSIFAI